MQHLDGSGAGDARPVLPIETAQLRLGAVSDGARGDALAEPLEAAARSDVQVARQCVTTVARAYVQVAHERVAGVADAAVNVARDDLERRPQHLAPEARGHGLWHGRVDVLRRGWERRGRLRPEGVVVRLMFAQALHPALVVGDENGAVVPCARLAFALLERLPTLFLGARARLEVRRMSQVREDLGDVCADIVCERHWRGVLCLLFAWRTLCHDGPICRCCECT